MHRPCVMLLIATPSRNVACSASVLRQQEFDGIVLEDLHGARHVADFVAVAARRHFGAGIVVRQPRHAGRDAARRRSTLLVMASPKRTDQISAASALTETQGRSDRALSNMLLTALLASSRRWRDKA